MHRNKETSSDERLKLARERDFLYTKHEGDDENIRQWKERYFESQETLYLVLAFQCDLKPLKFSGPPFPHELNFLVIQVVLST